MGDIRNKICIRYQAQTPGPQYGADGEVGNQHCLTQIQRDRGKQGGTPEDQEHGK